jgi:hypothetical protein
MSKRRDDESYEWEADLAVRLGLDIERLEPAELRREV